MRRISEVCALLALLIVHPFSSGTATAQDIKVGLVVPITGPFAVLGTSQQQGAVLAVEQLNASGGVNGRKIDLQVEDSGASPTTAVTALRRSLQGSPTVVLGPIMGTQVLAMAADIQRDGVPFLVIPGTMKVTQIGNPWIFRFQVTDMVSRQVVTRYTIEKLGRKKVGLIHVNDEYGHGGREVTVEVLKKQYNLAPVAVEAYAPTDRDVSAQLLKIKNAGADVLHVQGNANDIAVVLKQLKQLNFNVPTIASSALMVPGTLKLLADDELDGIYVESAGIPALSPDPRVKEWMKAFEARWKRPGDLYALQDYDAVMTMAEVMRKSGTNREAIQKAMREGSFKGLAGEVRSDRDGNMYHTSQIFRFEGRNPKLVETIELQPQR